MTSMSTGEALLLSQLVLSLSHFLQYFIPQNLGVASKVTTLAMYSMFLFAVIFSIYKRYLESPENATLNVG